MTATNATPTAQARPSWRFPAEWEPHAATWLGWPPKANRDWPGKLQAVQWAFCEMARKLTACGERVRFLVDEQRRLAEARRMLEASGADAARCDLWACPLDRNWMRDTGPMFVIDADGRRAVLDAHFNAWGRRYRTYANDARVAGWAAARLGLPRVELFDDARKGSPQVTLEGGSLDFNGRGSVVTTEECLLDARVQARNAGLGREGHERVLARYFGARNVIWLGRGIVGDDTHGHVDDLCRFVNPTTLVLTVEKNRNDANYQALMENRERLQDARLEDGSRPEVVELPTPAPLYFGRNRLPASYANFYVANEAAIVPTFNDPNDRVALGILAELFPGRRVEGIHAVDLVQGRGSIHCLTQQEPANPSAGAAPAA
jgi:agmatine deiminase